MRFKTQSRFLRIMAATTLITAFGLVAPDLAFAQPGSALVTSDLSAKETIQYSSSALGDSTLPVQINAQQITDINAIVAAADLLTNTFDPVAAKNGGASEQAITGASAVFVEMSWKVAGSTLGPSVQVMRAARCSGFNGSNGYHWLLGSQIGLNSCNTSKLASALGLGAAGAGAVAAILAVSGIAAPAGGVAGIVAALIGFGAAAVGTCQAWSPVSAIWLNLGGNPVASCWGQ